MPRLEQAMKADDRLQRMPPSHLLQKALPAKAVSNGSSKPAADSMVVISLPKSAREKKRMQ